MSYFYASQPESEISKQINNSYCELTCQFFRRKMFSFYVIYFSIKNVVFFQIEKVISFFDKTRFVSNYAFNLIDFFSSNLLIGLIKKTQ